MARARYLLLLIGTLTWIAVGGAEEKREEKVVVPLTKAELKALEQEAKKAHLDLPDFVRSKVLEGIEVEEGEAKKTNDADAKQETAKADSPLKGWKVMEGTWISEKQQIQNTSNDGMILRADGEIVKKLRMRINQVTDEKFFRAALIIGTTSKARTEGKRIEIGVTLAGAHITVWECNNGKAEPVRISSSKMAIPQKRWFEVEIKCTGQKLSAKICGASLVADLPYSPMEGMSGVLVNKGRIVFEAR